MKKLLCIFSLFLFWQWAGAQTPRWVEKAKRSVFSVVTYDKDNHILNTGNGFFVSEDGVALSDYSLFRGAVKAVIINSDGKQMPVASILGANEIYDVIKFRVGITEKKVMALTISTASLPVNSEVWMLPYSTQKSIASTSGKIKEVSKVLSQYGYYTLNMSMKDKMVSCPVINSDGQVFGLVQKATTGDTLSTCYAVDARLAMDQKINALSLSDATLKSIGIKKSLPDTEEQALVYLFMASSQLSSEDYLNVLNDFIQLYPNSSDGYVRRANQYLFLSKADKSMLDKANEDLERALKVAQKKDDVHYNIARFMYNYQLNKPEKTYKDWTYDSALEHVKLAYDINPLPIYTQFEGDLLFVKQDYTGAFSAYDKVNKTNLASPASFFSAAKTKELMKGDLKDIVVLMDSCVARCPNPMTADASPYLLERAQYLMDMKDYRKALVDYDNYYYAVNGKVNDLFYYYREQAAINGKQYQKALDDIAKAIELSPKDLLYRAEYAAVNLKVGRYDEAIKIIKEGLQIDSKYGELYRLLGICQLQLKKPDEACQSFAKAKELGDPNVDALIQKHCKK